MTGLVPVTFDWGSLWDGQDTAPLRGAKDSSGRSSGFDTGWFGFSISLRERVGVRGRTQAGMPNPFVRSIRGRI